MPIDPAPSPGSESGAPGPTPDSPVDAKPPDEELGAAGLKALATERDARKAAEKEAKRLARELEALKAEGATEAEKALILAKQEGLSEGIAKANARILRAEVIAAAAGKLRDPSLAPRLVDMDEITVDENGDVDAKAVEAAIDELLKAHPYLAATAKDAPKRTGSDMSGAGGQNGKPDINTLLRAAAGK